MCSTLKVQGLIAQVHVRKMGWRSRKDAPAVYVLLKIFKAQEGSTAKTRLWQQLRGTRILVNLYGETNGSKFARGLIGIWNFWNCGE